MTTWKPKNGTTFRYDFYWKGRRYTGSTDQVTKEDADLVESEVRKRLRQQAWGIAPFDRERTPSFSKWAEFYFAAQQKRVTRPDIIERTLRMVLAFWGATPSKEPIEGAPYHNLRLADPILDPEWLERFERWMDARKLSGSTKNSYRSALSGMFKLAKKPAWRKRTGITTNPCEGIERDAPRSRSATLSVEQLQAWILHAAPHVRLALAIGALAPKLRLASILGLRWDTHLDPHLTFITNDQHKTIRTTGAPQVIPIDPQLRGILAPAQQAAKKAKRKHVITYHGRPVKNIRKALENAAEKAGIPYGRSQVTFHTLRHTMATMLAELGVPEKQRQMVMGHQDLSTTQRYTHLRPIHEAAPLATLSAAVPIAETVMGPVVGPRKRGTKKPEQNATTPKRALRVVGRR